MGSHRVGHDLSDLAAAGRSLEEGMATHSSILACLWDSPWRIPWTKEPGGLQSMGLQRGGRC